MNLIADKPSRKSIVNKDELQIKMKKPKTIIIDVRPLEEYRNLHLPGAVSIPLSTLKTRLNEIPKEKEVITYCRDNYCILADKAVNILLDKGFDAKRLDIGLVEWKKAGLPIESDVSSES
jgi:rhodanese-related sulfurtransferase